MQIIGSCTSGTKIEEVRYGVCVTGVTSHPASVYIKVNKRCVGENVKLRWTSNYCVLLNLKTGGIRAVPHDTRVVVLNGKVHVEDLDRDNYPDFIK